LFRTIPRRYGHCIDPPTGAQHAGDGMELTEEAIGEVTIVAVNGRLDAESSRQFAERLATLICSGRSRLLIDASNLSYVGSMGFRALLRAAKLADEYQGKLALCALTAPVRRIVEIGGFGDVLEYYAARDEALAKLRAGP
jgi:anti-anti-sigma factor